MYQREGKSAYKKDLGNTQAVCKILDNPERKFKSIHIAGTNGKGSCSHLLASVFQEAGYKTGLYTSPHLKDFRERIRINGEMISEKKVVQFVEEHSIDFKDISPSFFEWTVALAFDHFANEAVDIAIIETGLGGRLDSTNVIRPILSVITNIDWDHMDMLGDTLEKIAIEKAGIIKEGTPVVIGNRSGVEEVFIQKAKEKNAAITFTENLHLAEEVKSDLEGEYQLENLKTVFGIWLAIRKNEKIEFAISYPQFLRGIQKSKINTSFRGRWEIILTKPKTIVDVAHNEAGLKITLRQLQKEKFDQLHIVLGMVKDKDLSKILSLFPTNANYYFCAAKIPRSLTAAELKKAANEIGLIGKEYSSVKEAMEAASVSAKDTDVIYIGGSNFIVAEAL